MKVAAIITARGGSKSIPKKNIILINNHPLIAYPILAARQSSCLDVFVDTDSDEIGKIAIYYGAKFLKRPASLGGDTVHHGDVIRYACQQLLQQFNYDAFLVLLGNTVMIDSPLIDQSISLLANNFSATGVCSVWKAADDHPYRSMQVNKDGYLESFDSVNRPDLLSTDRSSYPDVFYYDQGVWLFRASNLKHPKCGPTSWDWLGEKVIPIVREWVTGRDINGPFDVPFHQNWDQIKNTPADFPVFKAGIFLKG